MHLVRIKRYEEGGHRILSETVIWSALLSSTWQLADKLGEKDPDRFYLRPERWVLIAKWFKLLEEETVGRLSEAVREDVRADITCRVREAGGEGTREEVLAVLGSMLVDLYSREMLTTTSLEPVMTLQGFFKPGDFPAKRKELPHGVFESGVILPGSTSPTDWRVLEAALMGIYSVGCILTGEYPQMLVTHLSAEVTGQGTCFAVTPWKKPYACQAAWAAAVMDPYSRGSKVFKQMTEILKRSTSDSERASVFRWIQDVAAKVVAWSTELRGVQ